MKVSYNWLKEFIDFSYSPEELGEVLTMTGLEVAGIERTGGLPEHLEGVVVGEVLAVEQHPNADRLRLCQVSVGEEESLQIVCGAPNVAAGQKVPVARVGTTLHPVNGEPIKLKKGKIRGEVSMGMICAEDELGLGEDHTGIMVLEADLQPGTSLREAIETDEDFIIEIDLTPNRIDAASHYGVARDLAAVLRQPAKRSSQTLEKSDIEAPNPVPVTVRDPEKCPRYTSIYIANVTVKPSPEWMQNRLRGIGLRPINNIVDITNYVMMELGQPMHAFDADELQGGEVVVQTLDSDQKFITLDEEERGLLAGQDLMICDSNRPLCIGGVMGGLNSGVTTETQNVFLEAAYFDPGTVRSTSKRLGLSSDSSFRFERGADPHMTEVAALRAAWLIRELADGKVLGMSDEVAGEFPPFAIDLSLVKLKTIAGKDLGERTVIDILEGLEIEVKKDGDTLHLKVPSYRVDVQRDVDVMEDILRIYGYNNIEPSVPLRASVDFRQHHDDFQLRQQLSDMLSATGYYEIVNNSLVSGAEASKQAVHLVNPLSEDLSILRESMLPGALEAVRYNQNRQQEDLAFYEFGKTYRQGKSGYQEQKWLALTISGQQHSPHWSGAAPKTSLFTLRREAERLQAWLGFQLEWKELEAPDFEYGLEGWQEKQSVIKIGRISESLIDTYDLRLPVFHLIADWEALQHLHLRGEVQFQDIPQYPSIRRDISLLIDESMTFDEIRKTAAQGNPKLIRSIELHDIYKGKGIPEGKKSYLLSLELRDDKKTLEDKSADKVMERVVKLLEKQTGAELRK